MAGAAGAFAAGATDAFFAGATDAFFAGGDGAFVAVRAGGLTPGCGSVGADGGSAHARTRMATQNKEFKGGRLVS